MNDLGSEDFRLGGWLVRPLHGEICRGKDCRRLEPRSMAVLLALCEGAPRPVSKEELIRTVWDGSAVSDGVLSHAIWDVRRAFGDRPDQPRVVKTLPKRGYQVIAPITAVSAAEATGGVTDRWRRSGIGLTAAAGVGAVAVLGVLLVPRLETEPTAEIEGRLQESLRRELNLPQPGAGSSCSGEEAERPALPIDGYCVSATVRTEAETPVAQASVEPSGGAGVSYHSPPIALSWEAIEIVASELGELVTAFLDVVEMEAFHDPDLKPWVSLRKYDVRAIRSFLSGAAAVYLNEVGGWSVMEEATRHDEGFPAPWVWRTPHVARFEGPEAKARHRRKLETLGRSADGFEAAMIQWAIALVDGDEPVQIRWLKLALKQQDHRPAKLYLAGLHMGQGNFEAAWPLFADLLEQRWHFPALYEVSARCALHLGDLGGARGALELALEHEAVDPAVYDLLRLFAVYDDRREAERDYRRRLELRKVEISPEEYGFDPSSYAAILAAAAAGENRNEIANRLREFAE